MTIYPTISSGVFLLAMNIRRFLRLQSNTYLLSMRDKIASDVAGNVEYTSLSQSGKTVGQKSMVKVTELADALVDILVERGIQGSDYKAPTRMVRARFK